MSAARDCTSCHDEVAWLRVGSFDHACSGFPLHGAFELPWRTPGHGLHNARRELEAALGPLP